MSATVHVTAPAVARFRIAAESRRPEFASVGYNRAHAFFAHRVYVVPRAGPDGLRLARWLMGVRDPDRLWQILLHAEPAARSGLPPSLFVDDDVMWHRQQLGLPGHVACATVVRRGRTLHVLCMGSDLVQRIARRAEFRTLVDRRFGGWPDLLLNAAAGVARELGCDRLRVPASARVMRHTDPARDTGPALFEHVYDHTPRRRARAQLRGDWWDIDLTSDASRFVQLVPAAEPLERERTICLCHDIERGRGHRDTDPAFAQAVEAPAQRWLTDMLDIERAAGVRATYNVVGELIPDVRQQIVADGHCMGFHSYDHSSDARQLDRCRSVDARIRGYRPPRSRRTWELRPANLCLHGIDWFASGEQKLRRDRPRLRRRVVEIPIAIDDYALYRNGMDYDRWEEDLLRLAQTRLFLAAGFHDCYADRWLRGYERLLETLQSLGRLATLDDVAADTALASAL